MTYADWIEQRVVPSEAEERLWLDVYGNYEEEDTRGLDGFESYTRDEAAQ